MKEKFKVSKLHKRQILEKYYLVSTHSECNSNASKQAQRSNIVVDARNYTAHY